MSLGDMITRITSELSRTDISAEASAAIISAVDYYEDERFHFNEFTTSITTSAGQAEYSLPDDFQGMDSLLVTVNNYRYELEEKPYSWIVSIDSNPNYNGRPYDYGIFNLKFRLYPKPIDSYILTMNYVRELSISASLSATSPWFDEAEELIRTHAKVDILENVIRGKEAYEDADRLRLREQMFYDRLQGEFSKRKTGSQLIPTAF